MSSPKLLTLKPSRPLTAGTVAVAAAGLFAIFYLQPNQFSDPIIAFTLAPVLKVVPAATANSEWDYVLDLPDPRIPQPHWNSRVNQFSPSELNYYEIKDNNKNTIRSTTASGDTVNNSIAPGTIENSTQRIETGNRSEDLWQQIRDNFGFPEMDNRLVRKHVKFYSKRPEYFERILKRASIYLPYIYQQVDSMGMPSEIALLPIIESAYNPRARSRAGAVGLWQFMPFTGKEYGLKQNWWYEGRRDIIASTAAALDYLNHLYLMFDNDWTLALAAYNAGENGIHRAIRKNQNQNKSTRFSDLKLKQETSNFVPKLIAVKKIIANPEAYGIDIPKLSSEPAFEIVQFNFQVDLAILAHRTKIQKYELEQLNPGLRRNVTPPSGPHRILVPSEKQGRVVSWISDLHPSHAVVTAMYQVKPGDVLGAIAQRYNVSVASIKSINSMKSDLIRIGEVIRIPNPSSIRQHAELINQDNKAGGQFIHQVELGEVLGTIAQRYNVSVAKLRTVNSLNSDLIRVGQKLRIPIPNSIGQFASNPNAGYNLTTGTRYIHKVKLGESLWGIARLYQVNVTNLLNWNDIDSGTYIHPGQSIVVYVN